jgi:hypothetical protein
MQQHQIFISYSHLDNEFACKLYDDLLSDSYLVWMDPDLEELEEWRPQIELQLKKSGIVIALISSNSVKSKWVHHEGAMAYALGRSVLPVKIEEFGKYQPKELPVWAEETQLFNFVLGAVDYQGRYQSRYLRLKQRLGKPLQVQKFLDELIIQYRREHVLMDKGTLDLIRKHYNDLDRPPDLDNLIEDSERELLGPWLRIAALRKSYKKSQMEKYELNYTNEALRSDIRLRDKVIISLVVIFAFYVFTVIFLELMGII